jgi:type IV secretory pathway TraG/TraD family ATPase VirD4
VAPHSLPREKSAINQLIKGLFFYLAASRYDIRKFGPVKENLLVCFLDEYQKSCSLDDKNFLDILRAAKCAFIAAVQDYQSIHSALGNKEVADNIIGKFRNRIFFAAEQWESAESASKLLGTKKVWKYSYTYGKGGGSRSRNQVDEPKLKPEHFFKLANHRCTIIHADRTYRKNIKLPLV